MSVVAVLCKVAGIPVNKPFAKAIQQVLLPIGEARGAAVGRDLRLLDQVGGSYNAHTLLSQLGSIARDGKLLGAKNYPEISQVVSGGRHWEIAPRARANVRIPTPAAQSLRMEDADNIFEALVRDNAANHTLWQRAKPHLPLVAANAGAAGTAGALGAYLGSRGAQK